MCEPITMSLALGSMAVGTGIGIYGKIKAANYQAGVDENNAKIANMNARAVMGEGVNTAAAVMAEGRALNAKAVTAAAAGGTETTTGSTANIFAVNSAGAAIDAEQAKVNAANQAWGLKNEARDLRSQAGMRRRTSILGGIGEGIGAAGSIASTGYQMYKSRPATK